MISSKVSTGHESNIHPLLMKEGVTKRIGAAEAKAGITTVMTTRVLVLIPNQKSIRYFLRCD